MIERSRSAPRRARSLTHWIPITLVTLVAPAAATHSAPAEGEENVDLPDRRFPVILDTDIGDDIDDTWALVMLLKSPELDVRLVVGDQQKSLYRARLIAKILQLAGRTDIPVGIGTGSRDGLGRQAAWVEGFHLKDYPGRVHEDGVGAIIDTILGSKERITLIAIGPMPNIAAALERQPSIARRARFVGMHGSVRLGYGGSKETSAEYNVRADVGAAKKVFTAPWDMTITPLDTCGLVQLGGNKYASVRDGADPVTSALVENYRIWAGKGKPEAKEPTKSSTLFDTVAIYLAFSDDLVDIEALGIRVTDDGHTVIDPAARKIRVATRWKDLGRFEDLLVERVTSPTVKRRANK